MKEIEDTIKSSKSTLTLTLLDLGYKYKKSSDNRRLLYDQRSVINDQCKPPKNQEVSRGWVCNCIFG
jgi:hypothetical protein